MISGLYRKTREERIEVVARHAGLSEEELRILNAATASCADVAEHCIENSLGTFALPIGVATSLKVDGIDRLLPMAVEETSIVAALSSAAKWVRQSGEIRTSVIRRNILGQMQFRLEEGAFSAFRDAIEVHKLRLIQMADQVVPGLVRRGGGARGLEARELVAEDGVRFGVAQIELDPCDAMGANLVNQVCEALSTEISSLTGAKAGLRILSNHMSGSLVRVELILREVASPLGAAIEDAWRFADTDVYRACTHNKGIMNGIDPILIATGNDWRAVEAGVHAYAARSGRYRPLSCWSYREGTLLGEMELPLSVGTVGGVTRIHPVSQIALRLIGAASADELARVVAAAGLTQNLAALRALCTDGIVKGHMQLHAVNLALLAGAREDEIEKVRGALVEAIEKRESISASSASEVLRGIRGAPTAR